MTEVNLRAKFKQNRLDAMPEIGKSICDFCVDNAVENVIFLDRSARPAYIPFKEQWKKNYPDKQRPSMYFVSPKIMEQYGVGEEEVAQFKKEHPYLTKEDKPTLVFDVCVKEGLTIHNMNELLIKAGFSEVYSLVTAVHKDKKQYVLPNVVLYDNHNLGCHVFGQPFTNDLGVERNQASFIVNKKSESQSYINTNRKELLQASKISS